MDNNEIEILFQTLDKNLNINKKEVKCCDIEENFDIKNSVVTCLKCNNVISNILNNPEWKYYGSEDTKLNDPNRCGMPINMLLPNSSVGTTISNCKTQNKDIHKVKRFQKWNSMTYSERSRYNTFNEIKSICEKNDIPLIIIKEASSLYTMVSQVKITRGNNRKGLIAACVYFACKNCSVPRSSKEIAKIFILKNIVVTKGIKQFQELMQIKKKSGRIEKQKTIDQSDFIERFCSNLKIDEKYVKKIIEMSNKSIDENTITENTPPSIAAGCIYKFCLDNNINISKRDISEICNISEVTINKCYLKLC